MDALLHRHEPTNFEQFKDHPFLFLAQKLYYWGTNRLSPPTPLSPVRIVCISDTHNHHAELPPLPDGDVLIHAGDLTHSGTPDELSSALQWLSIQPHAHKIFIAGNHDQALASNSAAFLAAFPSLIYLNETSVTIEVRGRALKIYGSPLTPSHGAWVFQYPRRSPADAHWDQIPPQTDVLITHGPPAHHVDRGNGCAALLDAVWRVRPRLHVFGHIHAARGVEHVAFSAAQAAYERVCARTGGWWDLCVMVFGIWRQNEVQTTFVNAASLGGFRDEQRRSALTIDILGIEVCLRGNETVREARSQAMDVVTCRSCSSTYLVVYNLKWGEM